MQIGIEGANVEAHLLRRNVPTWPLPETANNINTLGYISLVRSSSLFPPALIAFSKHNIFFRYASGGRKTTTAARSNRTAVVFTNASSAFSYAALREAAALYISATYSQFTR
jgi:hypothetical protein